MEAQELQIIVKISVQINNHPNSNAFPRKRAGCICSTKHLIKVVGRLFYKHFLNVLLNIAIKSSKVNSIKIII